MIWNGGRPSLLERNLGILLLFTVAGLSLLVDVRLLGPLALRLADDIRNDGPNGADRDRLTEDYYQELMTPNPDAGLGWPERAARIALGDAAKIVAPEPWTALPITRPLRGPLPRELVPNMRVTHAGVDVVTNCWGMRDDDYAMEKPPGTFRIALIGASNDVGWGVPHGACYEALLEDRLNREFGGRGRYRRYEILNFSVPGFTMLEFPLVARERVLQFDPDLIFVATNVTDFRTRVVARLADRVQQEMPMPDDQTLTWVRECGANSSMLNAEIRRKLNPYRESFYEHALRKFSDLSQTAHLPVVVLVLRLETGTAAHPKLNWIASTAERHNLRVIRAFDSLRGRTATEVYIDPRADQHPTELAHHLIAHELFEQLRADPRLLEIVVGGDLAS